MIEFSAKFSQAHLYDDFLARYAAADHRRQWQETHRRVQLTTEQATLLGSFVREMNVLCLAGAWCGDCAAQCPIFDHFSRQSPRIQLRFVDRDADRALSEELRQCGGHRVPMVVFLSEDFTECGRYGDRTLTAYRRLVANNKRGLIAGPESGSDETLAVVDDWLREFERIQHMLVVSPRLRKKHEDRA